MDETLRYRAEQLLSNFPLDDEDVNEIIKEWVEVEFDEYTSEDTILAKLNRIAFRKLRERKNIPLNRTIYNWRLT